MLAKPSTPPNSVDPRLRALADPELSDRLIADHPQLYPALERPEAALAQAAKARPSDADEPGSDEVWRMLAIVGLLLAVVAAYELGFVMRARMNADIPPLVSLVSASRAADVQAVIWRHPNLGPAAAAKLERMLPVTRVMRARALTRAISAPPLPKLNVARQTGRAKVLAEKMHAAASPRFHEAVGDARASALVASAAVNEAQAASSSDTEASSDAVVSSESGSPGRQIPHGPVWSENGPGSVVPGAIVLGRGRFPGGGGMPGGCPH